MNERYKKMFDAVAEAGMTHLDADHFAMQRRPKRQMRRTVAAAMAAVMLLGASGVAYAANIGGVRQTIQLWIRGEETTADLQIDGNSYAVQYVNENGETVTDVMDGIAFDEDGTQRPLTEEEMMGFLEQPEVVYKEDGTVWVYYYAQSVDITDSFEDGTCVVTLTHENQIVTLTIDYREGWTVSYSNIEDGDN